MPRKTEDRPERAILLFAGESGVGKSFFMGNLRNALIFDSDIGGGLAYLDARIRRNGSERVEVGSYLDIVSELSKRRGRMDNISTVGIDHLTSLQQESVLRWNPDFEENTFGREHDRANKEWRKIRELVRWGDFNLICASHLKNKYEKKVAIGLAADGSKNIEADMTVVLHVSKTAAYPSVAKVVKWRRDPDDPRGKLPTSFPFTVEKFAELHGFPLQGERNEEPMASPEDVAELTRLLAVVRLPEGLTDQWLTKAKVDSWADMTQATIRKCVSFLQDKLAKPTEAT